MFQLPFSSQEFFGVFAAYNEAIWPAQVLLLAAAVAAAALAVWRGERAARAIWSFVALLWLWAGLVYHLLHFSRINPAANVFGVLFVAQAGLLTWRGVLRGDLPFRARLDRRGVAGGLLLLYALVLYPLLGLAMGHALLAGPTFGAPCPIVIYTFGLLLLAPRAPGWLLAIPALWAVLGISAAIQLGVWQDLGLPVAAVVAVALVLERHRARRRAEVADGPPAVEEEALR